MKELNYPVKILVAWGEAIAGNKKIRDWLIKNGYPELGLFCFALRNNPEARKWLLENKHPHLMALINAVEENPPAFIWLRKQGFPVLEQIARVGIGDENSKKWLIAHDLKLLAVIGEKIRLVKDQIQRDNDDPHKIDF